MMNVKKSMVRRTRSAILRNLSALEFLRQQWLRMTTRIVCMRRRISRRKFCESILARRERGGRWAGTVSSARRIVRLITASLGTGAEAGRRPARRQVKVKR